MSESPAIDEKRLFVIDQQVVRVEDVYRDEDLILDLGGGGEGVIGQLRKRQVVAVDSRQEELDESAEGPIKIVADAKELPFLDESFDVATAFFFLMYVPAEDRAPVLKEAHRVLKPGGKLHIWDVMIPARDGRQQQAFVVPVRAELPGSTIETGYGVSWDGREMSAESVATMAQAAGFTVSEKMHEGETFRLTLVR
ncbi:class I SAM-dependent methyltransferase [Candidatus Bipolaricaulota bacterium]